jgi:hypothetical protein
MPPGESKANMCFPAGPPVVALTFKVPLDALGCRVGRASHTPRGPETRRPSARSRAPGLVKRRGVPPDDRRHQARSPSAVRTAGLRTPRPEPRAPWRGSPELEVTAAWTPAETIRSSLYLDARPGATLGDAADVGLDFRPWSYVTPASD